VELDNQRRAGGGGGRIKEILRQTVKESCFLVPNSMAPPSRDTTPRCPP